LINRAIQKNTSHNVKVRIINKASSARSANDEALVVLNRFWSKHLLWGLYWGNAGLRFGKLPR